MTTSQLKAAQWLYAVSASSASWFDQKILDQWSRENGLKYWSYRTYLECGLQKGDKPMRTGKPNDAKPGEIYISPESMDVLKSLYPPSTDITTGDLPHIRWSDVKEPHYHNKEGKKLYYVSGLGWNTKECG